MTPDTVHLLAQLIRHSRGMATALEAWLRVQPESKTVSELREMTGAYRGVLTTYESQLSRVIVDGGRSVTSNGTEVSQPTRTAAGRLGSPLTLTRVR